MNKIMVFVIGLVIMGKLNMESEDMMDKVRLGYCLSCLYSLFGHYWIYMAMEAKKDKEDKEEFIVTPAKDGRAAQKSTKYKYDLDQFGSMFQSYAMGILMSGLMHIQMGEPRILFFQAIISPFAIIETPLFRIHLLGEGDTQGDLIRPWKAPGLFGYGGDGGGGGGGGAQAVTQDAAVTGKLAPERAPVAAQVAPVAAQQAAGGRQQGSS